MVLWDELFALPAQAVGSHWKFLSLVAILWKNHVGVCEEDGLKLGAGTGKMVVEETSTVPGTRGDSKMCEAWSLPLKKSPSNRGAGICPSEM